jgi:hypothetical protein
VRDNWGVVIHTVPELHLAEVASRSSLVGALVSTVDPATRNSLLTFLEGLSRDELQCIAEFQGACIIEAGLQPEFSGISEYRMLAEFFDASFSERWPDSGERCHKTFVVLAWLDLRKSASPATISFALS